MDKNDLAALDRLRAASADYKRLTAERQQVRARRDFLILAAWRRGVSLRVIADAAGVHFSRVAQLVAEARRVVDENHLTPLRPKGAANRRRRGK